MLISISKTKLLSFLFSIAFIIIITLVIYGAESLSLQSYTFIIIITLIFKIIMFRLSKIKILSFSFLFIISTYVFHFSYVFLIYFNYNFTGYLERDLAMNRFGVELFYKVLILSYFSVYAVFIGILFANFNLTNEKVALLKKNPEDINSFLLGTIFVLISLPMDLYILLSQTIQMIIGGYTAVHEYEVNYIIKLLSYLFLPGLYLMITSSKFSRKQIKIILIMFVIYKLISMITGLRAYNLISIFVFIYLYYKTFKIRVSKKYLSMGLLLFIPLSNLLIVIRESRHTGIDMSNLLSNLLKLDNNIIFNIMSEFGLTINMVAYVYNSMSEPTGGTQLLTSALSIIPNVSHIFSSENLDTMTIVGLLDIWNMGGSYIADFYFDFGYWGIFFCLIYGFVIHRLNNVIDIEILKENYVKIAFLIPILVEVIFTVRSTVGKLPRMIVWYSVIYLIIALFVKIMKKKRRK